MNQREILTYYLESSKHDRKICLKLFDDKEYLSSLFFAHLSIEKLLKILIVQNTGQLPPYIHQLVQLLKRSKIEINDNNISSFLIELTEYNILGRYPEYKAKVRKILRQEFVYDKIQKYLSLYDYLCSKIKPSA